MSEVPATVIEVLSPSTAQRDKTEKFDLYESQGVDEYWLVEPRDRLIEIYSREGGSFRRVGVFTPGQTFTSPVLDQSIDVTGIFELGE